MYCGWPNLLSISERENEKVEAEQWVDENGNVSEPYSLFINHTDSEGNVIQESIGMQYGPRKEVGINGFLDEDVLKFIKLRLEYFQDKLPCEETAKAIEHLTYAINALNNRTERRENLGIEGTSEEVKS